ncbi:MAG: hypothetical protein ACYTBX_00295 [Planctomycetota bacterium]|jgi:hypothetical protein
MKDIYKNPILYYILVPVVVALWALLVWAIYLPQAEESSGSEEAQCRKAEQIMLEIFNLDPDRGIDANNAPSEFTYAVAVNRIAGLCKIPSTKYKLSSRMIMKSDRQRSQSANVVLKEVDIVSFSRFLSLIQKRWANLQCNRVKLTKKEGLPDVWDVDIEFKYYY